jgi:lipoic acid synthetase
VSLQVRWLGRVAYNDALALQHALHADRNSDYVLLLEHPHVYTLGVRARPEHVLVSPERVGADLVKTDRGGDVTYHGPGQLVAYPIVTVPPGSDANPRHVHGVEQLVIDALADVGLPGAARKEGYPGVWIEDRKIAAIGIRITKGRSMHGFALNVDPDLAMFDHIVPCGITEFGVTSLAREGVSATMHEVVDAVIRRAVERFGGEGPVDVQQVAHNVERSEIAPFTRGDAPAEVMSGRAVRADPSARLMSRLSAAGVDADHSVPVSARKPEWLRVKADLGPGYRQIRHTMRSLDLSTVCEEAGCPNIFECWRDGTATFMINGERCTRACGFCLVDTRHPRPLDPEEPQRLAEAVDRMDLSHVVITAVARDDLDDGGALGFADCIRAVRARRPATTIEVLIPDCKGDPDALAVIFDERPDVANHNLETVARLQRAVRPSASYARSLAVLARAKEAGLVAKSGMILGMGETHDEVVGAMSDLRSVGVDIITLGQYLRPTSHHLPVARWWSLEEFSALRDEGQAMGFAHVEASPLTRSSYHAGQAFHSAGDAISEMASVPAT